MKRCLMATLATVTLAMALTSLAGCGGDKGGDTGGGPPGAGGPRSEEATIRVRNGASLVVEFPVDTTAKWIHDSNANEWTQQGRNQSKAELKITINQNGGDCQMIPPDRKSVRVVHADGTNIEFKLANSKTRIKDGGALKPEKADTVLKYSPSTPQNDFIKEIFVGTQSVCKFTDEQQLKSLDLEK